MGLRLLQHPNSRHPHLNGYGEIKAGHPHGFEPPFQCEETDCTTCIALKSGREFINECFIAQHQENSNETVQGKKCRRFCSIFVLFNHKSSSHSKRYFFGEIFNRQTSISLGVFPPS